MFRVTADGHVSDAKFHHPMAAISSALTLSMGAPRGAARVEVNGTLVCIARDGALFDAEGCELTPAEAVRAAELAQDEANT